MFLWYALNRKQKGEHAMPKEINLTRETLMLWKDSLLLQFQGAVLKATIGKPEEEGPCAKHC